MCKKIISIIMVCLMAIGFASCSEDKEQAASTSAATNVTVCKAEIGSVNKTVKYTGEVKATSVASVTPKVSAIIQKINVEVGDFVNAGDVLMVLDSTQYSQAYNQAQAAYNSAVAAKNNAMAAKESAGAAQNSAQASYDSVTEGNLEQTRIALEQAVANAQSAYNTALDNYNRQLVLYENGAISKVALDAAKTQLDNASIALESAKANLELNQTVIVPHTEASAGAGVNQANAGVNQAEAGIKQAEAGMKQASVALEIAASNVANCTINAPISGYVASKNFVIGQMASPGYEAFSIKNSDMLDVEINVTEAVIGMIKAGSKANITVKSAKVENVEAYVSVVSETKNEATGMYMVKVAIPNEDGKIKVGMMADVTLTTESVNDVLTIDYNALINENGKYFVYVADGDKAIKKEVEVGIFDDKKAQILSGIKKGESVVLEGKDFLSEKNNEIKIVK